MPRKRIRRGTKLPKTKDSLGRKAFASYLKELGYQVTKLQNDLAVLSGANNIIYNNQKELVDSAERLDDQFAVLSRLTVRKLNEFVHKLNMSVGQDLIEPITYEEQNLAFMEWAEFRKRPDWRNYTRAWFTGADLSELPPPPEPEVKEEPDTLEGAELFGGNDDVDRDCRDPTATEDRSQDRQDCEEDALPILQDNDETKDSAQPG